MSDILTLVFKTLMSKTGVNSDFRVASSSPTTCGNTLLLGDHSISRSVLLLAAVTAAETGMKVIFFTQTQIQSLPVSLQKCVPNLSPESLKKIKFCYPCKVDELLQQVASLHESINLYPTPSSLIIIDRLDGYLCGPGGGGTCGLYPGEQSLAAHLSALLCDTSAFLTQLLKQRSSSSGPCCFIASFQSEVDLGKSDGEASTTDPILEVLDRYFQVRCTLDRDCSYEAAAAGLQEVWHIYFSGTCITQASCIKDREDRQSIDQEWQLLIFPDGVMEFKLV
ncbi:ATPase SWSAP1 [Notolabrus celidotus]|uniref:ATPase SWSAP1 n=1 Tax=Notolabrus celidotus TaxID=1203425 RepID=UPI0014906975|nr:ATPase SWSAP1 [Notolabrus celidotus]